MTSTTKSTACTNCGLKLTKSNTAHAHGDIGVHDVCHFCYASWAMENEHDDYDDHDETTQGCPSCGTFVKPTAKVTKPATSTQVHTKHTSHAACDHASTPAARAKCRKERAK